MLEANTNPEIYNHEPNQSDDSMLTGDNWWKGAVIYQIYPRSLKDSNGDGIGDLKGIEEKLDYISSLGVDAIWISPFFQSPMKDYGYDISDYRKVDAIFGTLEDFDRVVDKAHRLNIKVIIDQVLSHTSDQHEWFQESAKNRNNDKSDWYVWADAKSDGSVPNNWVSIFGGSAWQWEPKREQFYLHNFLTSQPDLNFHNSAVQKASLDNIEFWLKRGVDGFRLDAINFCFHNQNLKDNPPKPVELRQGRGFSEDNPYAFQYHYYDTTQPENLNFIKRIRALLNQYSGSVALGEIQSEDSLKTMAEYTQGNEHLHMGYSFELLTEDFSANYIRETIETLEAQMTEGWPCWAISNHDVERVASRWLREDHSPDKVKLFSALLFCLRGSVCTYQGEELGLSEAEIGFDDLKDPYGKAFWPEFKGRDGCRTPMPWNNEHTSFGFSSGSPWLPIPKAHSKITVETQLVDKNSIINSFKNVLMWRKKHQSLIDGSIKFVKLNEPLLGFIRENKNEISILVFNLSNVRVSFSLTLCGFQLEQMKVEREHGIGSFKTDLNDIDLNAYSLFVGKINK